jgi:hypothetical protein
LGESEPIGKGKGIHLYSINGELKLPILIFQINEFWGNKLHVVDLIQKNKNKLHVVEITIGYVGSLCI